MTFNEAMTQLENCGTEQNIKVYKRHGAGENLYGVSFANLNKMKKKIKFDSDLALKLWDTGNTDARTLATMILKPCDATPELIEKWMKNINYHLLIDLLMKHVVSKMDIAQSHMEAWTSSDNEWYGRAGWTLLTYMAMSDKNLDDDFFTGYVDTIKQTIHKNVNRKREAMNNTLIAIGGRSDRLRKKCQDVAKSIGKVEVDHGDTSCKTPDAFSYIDKIWARKK